MSSILSRSSCQVLSWLPTSSAASRYEVLLRPGYALQRTYSWHSCL